VVGAAAASGDVAAASDDAAAAAEAADDAPCFARDSFAIDANGQSVAMASLRSGDVVMDGPDSYTRIIVNQHAAVSVKSSLLHISTDDATLSVTPDHVIKVDSKFAAARIVGVGSKLGEQEVVRVTSAIGEIINPLTASGKILTQGGILATTYPEWIAEFMLSSALFPLPLSLSNALSYLFPETTQASCNSKSKKKEIICAHGRNGHCTARHGVHSLSLMNRRIDTGVLRRRCRVLSHRAPPDAPQGHPPGATHPGRVCPR